MEISIAFKKQLYINNEPCSLCFRYNQTRYDFSTTFTIKKHEYTTSEFYNINDLKDYLTVLDEKINEFESEVLINCNKVKMCNLLIIKELIKTLFELNIKKG